MLRGRKNKKQKSSSWFMTILSYVLSLLLVALAVIGVLVMTICNGSFFKTQVLKSGFCTQVMQELEDNYVSYGTAGGFSAETMKSLLSLDAVQRDMFSAVEAFYNGERDVEQLEVLKNQYNAVLSADVESRGYSITPEIKQGVSALAEGCAVDYCNYVSIPFAPYLAPLALKLKGYMWIPLIVVSALIAATVALLVFGQKEKQRKLQYLIYACSAAMLLCAAFPALVRISVKMERINISPESFRVIVQQYLYSMLGAFGYFAFMYFVVVVAVGLTLYTIQQKQRQAYVQSKEYVASPAEIKTFRHKQPEPVQKIQKPTSRANVRPAQNTMEFDKLKPEENTPTSNRKQR